MNKTTEEHKHMVDRWLAENSVGHILNSAGYVSNITFRGYLYANPV